MSDERADVTMAMPSPEDVRLAAQTDEGAQLLRPLTGEAEKRELVLTGGPWPDAADTMIINMGPQHPSTHGVLRIMAELDGETVLRAKAVIGYLHTGMEKTGEELTYVQGGTNVTRMDYASPLSNELVFALAAERLLDIDSRRARRGSACCWSSSTACRRTCCSRRRTAWTSARSR